MKGDFSRNTFDKKKHFTSIRMQQGRVQLDADWNEQMDIIDNRIRVGSMDFIGGSGAPSGDPGYKITPTKTDLTIGKGRFYVQGILIENEKDFSYSSQTLPAQYVLSSQKTDGLYLAYLDVWQQGVNAAIDPSIEEPALNGADTTMRIKNVAQVKLLPLPNSQYTGTALKCSTVIDKDTKNKAAWQTAISTSTGKLSAKVSANANLKNQLYRVEIHKSGDQNTATFKWSRDNGALVGKIKSINSNIITISNTNNQTLNFKSGQWIEITTNQRTLQNKLGIFVQLLKVDNNQLTIVSWPANMTTSEFISGTVRQWDNNVTIINNDSNFTLLNVINKKPVRNKGKIDITLANNATVPTGLAVGKFIELSSSALSGNNKRGYFAEIEKISGSILTLNDGANPISDTILNTLDRFYFSLPGGLSLGKSNSINLENGLQIKFEKGTYKTGDYWLIPTRAETNNIVSAQYDFKTPQLPEGIVHYHAQLALLRKTGTTWQLADDCRNIISALGNEAYKSEPGDNESSVFVDKIGNVTVKKQLQVDGSAELKKGVTVTGETKTSSLTSTGNISTGSITTTGKTQTGSLQVDGSTTLKSSLSATGNVSAGSITTTGKIQTNSLQVDGSTILKSSLSATGNISAGSITTTGKTQTDSLQVDGSAELKKGVTVTGETKTSSLTSTGNINAGSITTTGKTQTGSLQVDGNTELKKGVTVTGETKTTTLISTGKTTTGSLQVDGSTELKKGVTVTGETKTSSLTSTGNVSASSITTTGKTQTGSLQVDGSTTLKSSLSATGNINAGSLTTTGKTQTGSLQVDGSTELKKGVTVTGETKTSSLTSTNNISAGSITTTGKTQTGSLQVDGSTELKKGATVTGETKTGSLTSTGNINAGSFGVTKLFTGEAGTAKSSYTFTLGSGTGLLSFFARGHGQTLYDSGLYLYAANYNIGSVVHVASNEAYNYVTYITVTNSGHKHTIKLTVNPTHLNDLEWSFIGLSTMRTQ